MEAFSIERAFPLFAIPFATSIVTVLGSPKAEPAQPRALVGGHLVSTLVGLLVVKLCGPAPWAAAVAVGLAMVAMHLTGTFHPCRHRSAGCCRQQHVLELSDCASWHRRRAARNVCFCLAQSRHARR
ncbi:HPP family protein [Bradyrhizobium sp. Ash2021]|nr:HPP family protein [Bradyrhizobium sp. Ash2021]